MGGKARVGTLIIPVSKPYVITTPSYYVNSVPHIGTALTTVAADVTARYQRMLGRTTFLITGTDENGLKVKEAAEKAGYEPRAFVDEISQKFVEIWKSIDVDYDDFLRTTEPRHIVAVQELFKRLQANGYVYTGTYEGWYDVSSETFFKESDLVDGKSPDGNEVRWVQEENYFFKMSAFGDRLLAHIEANPNFILPEPRKNEVISFIQQGLRDVCISRNNIGWGIPVPGDEKQVVYVWFDALINYIAAAGFPNDGWEERWPADVEWMGKDILTRFHATLWPAMLMGADLPLPKALVGHAWMLMGGEKISKSKGNVIPPLELAQALAAKSGTTERLAVDAVRYAMCALMPFETDSTFSEDEFERRYNADLANDLGNALNRSLAMAHKFVGGVIPSGEAEPEAVEAIRQVLARYTEMMDGFRIDHGVTVAWDLIKFLNKYIDTRAPWALAKNQDPELASVIRSMLLCLRTVEGLVQPFMPNTSPEIAAQLGLEPVTLFSQLGTEESLPAGTVLLSPKPLFPRLDLTVKPVEPKPPKPPKPMSTPAEKPAATEELIGIEDFMKVKLKVARIYEASIIEGSDKLYKLQLQIGDEKRQIVSGIRNNYTPEELIGRQIIVCVNLKPAKLRGVESNGMLLAATDETGGAILLMPEKEAPEGAPVK